MDLLNKYASSSENEDSNSDKGQSKAVTRSSFDKSEQKTDIHVPIVPSLTVKSSLAPEVDITDLQYNKQVQELTRFERETKIDTNQNHLTGYL